MSKLEDIFKEAREYSKEHKLGKEVCEKIQDFIEIAHLEGECLAQEMNKRLLKGQFDIGYDKGRDSMKKKLKKEKQRNILNISDRN